MADVMIDCETMGNGSKAAIIAIGAVKFDPKLKRIHDRFYSRVDLQSCLDVGLEVTAGTIMWWLEQSDVARAEFKGVLPPLKKALEGFSAWMNRQMSPTEKAHTVWGNGATFDNVILTNAYNALKMERPWSYKGDRCYRTVRAMYPDVKFKDHGVKHRADHDAEAQANHLMELWPLLRQS